MVISARTVILNDCSGSLVEVCEHQFQHQSYGIRTGKLNPVQLAIMASGLFGGVGVYWYGSTAFIHVDVRNGHATWLCTQKGVYNYTSSQAFIMPTVRRGSANATAKAANKMLQRLLGLPVDGIFGANTEAAVRAAQKTHSLTVDGVVGPKTWKALAGVQ